jgi:hypothetical protein
MDRTAEEFVHQLANGRWFVGDFVRTAADGQAVFLIPTAGLGARELSEAELSAPSASIRTYARKSAAKRAAQRMIERVLDEPLSEEP